MQGGPKAAEPKDARVVAVRTAFRFPYGHLMPAWASGAARPHAGHELVHP